MSDPPTKNFSFSLVLTGFTECSAEIEDALYEAGCDDGMLCFRGRVPAIEFDREASSMVEAITSAIADVDKANIGATILRVQPDDLVNASAIAERANRSREAVRLWIEGKRGPGNFPAPFAMLDRRPLWSWEDVAFWLAEQEMLSPEDLHAAQTLAVFNAFLADQRAISMEPEKERIAALLTESAMMARLRDMRASSTG